MKKNVIVSLSGGMDSSTLLLRCITEYENIIAVSFNYGQKHSVELERAKSLVEYVNSKGYNITYKQIKLEGLSELLSSNLVVGGKEVPEGHYEQETMKETVVPNRNKIFSSIVQAIALSTANRTGEKCDIALGVHSGDHAIYPDCRQEFRDADHHAFVVGNWNADRVEFYTPYLEGNKLTILRDGLECCNTLYIDFNQVYRLTNTSYKPIQHLGVWYSDYKSASSVERILAFSELGMPDPVGYADETGPVTWMTALNHALQVEKDYRTANG